jgi:hypothetical protein
MFRRCAAGRLPRRAIDGDVFAGVLAAAAAAARGADPDGSGWLDHLRVRVVNYHVRGLPTGLYRWDGGWTLTSGRTFATPELRRIMRPILVGQQIVTTAAVTLVLSLDVPGYQRMLPVERGLREAYVDAGRLAHYLIIGATAYGLRTHQSPATCDTPLLSLLGIDENRESLLYTLSFS